MKDSMRIIERFTNPSKHVQEPYGTLWKNGDSYFIQLSKDPETANWLSIGDFLAIVYKDYIENDEFIEVSLRVYDKVTS